MNPIEVIAHVIRADLDDAVMNETGRSIGDLASERVAATIAERLVAALREARIELVQLPEPEPGWWDCYEDEGDPPDHNSYGGHLGEFFVTTWHGHPGEVQVSHQGEPLEPIRPDDARGLAAALLAADRVATAAAVSQQGETP